MSTKKQANDVKIAAAYIRVSTDDQLEYSPDSQLEVIRDYARRNNMVLPPEFIFMEEEGRSGRKSANREKFQEIIGVAKSPEHPIDVILLWKFSRFARNQEESIFYKNRLRRLGVEVMSVSEPLPEGPFGSLVERIIEWQDEYYSINLAQEVRRGMTEKAKRGQLQSTASFGYRVDKDRNMLVIVPEEADLVREMFRRFLSGEGFFPIAKWLNSIGVHTHRGNKFENRTVEYILRNPVYIGKLRWTPTGRTRRDFNNPDSIIVEAQHEAIIDMDTWDATQERIRQLKERYRYKARPSSEKKHWLAGIVRCANCGSTLIFSAPHYFKCNNYVRGRCSTSQHIHIDLLEHAFLERLHSDMAAADKIDFHLISAADGTASELQLARRNLDGLQKKKERLREAFLAGADTVEEYKAMKEALEQQIAMAAAQVDDLAAGGTKKKTPALLRKSIKTALDILESPTATLAQKFDAADGIIENCTFSKENALLSITYRVVF